MTDDFKPAGPRLGTPTATMNPKRSQAAEKLRAWAPLISSGHEVPAAAQAMFEAADELDRFEAKVLELEARIRNLEPWGR